ncbi:MAG: hypothetical protein A2X42_01900 [Candidatus Margulisbacteria bacterium GWF2_38_17]|nr:MAG: hypothetical protein A2X42_01900 [Candidatus Margulisbacteria bacterium GWF2_38_17]
MIIGLGNDIICDDRIGLDLAATIADELSIPLAASQAVNLGLLSDLDGFDTIIIIDSIMTGSNSIGALTKLSLSDLTTVTGNYSTHQISFLDLINAGKAMGFSMPTSIIIYAIEILDNKTITEKMTTELQDKYPYILKEIKDDINHSFGSN